ncbi:Zn(II)2Cys6 transcription factor domain-containing protein [Aspergillus undulatus]|uniref:Zn(II)2Cys6 transcription factor domain-containing protein n=1 Tax=Aspergillus undulatus TaxID=1810928 RepID=UPI003CCD93BD
MVGVPGKAKGCNACRRRKRECDLQRRICGQCRKSSLVCGGYQRATIWINMNHETGPGRRYTVASEPEADPTRGWMNKQPWFFYTGNELGLPLRKALLAVALSSVGKRDGKPWMVESSIKLHGESLSLFASQLGRRDGKHELLGDISLATTRVLSLYEV